MIAVTQLLLIGGLFLACQNQRLNVDAFSVIPRATPLLPSNQLFHPSYSPKVADIAPPLKASIAGDSSQSEDSSTQPGFWPNGDALDKKLMKIAIPMICVFMVTPLMGAVDLFWVNRMGNPLAVAGQAASNQVYNTAFWLASFLPSGMY